MEKKGYYREFYPGYMGHIPYKYEVIGMTVGATNNHIKSFLRKKPDYEKTFVPSNKVDYTYYNKDYFTDSMAKNYPLEEDKIYSNKSKDARTWICGNKHVLYPEHIPGYTGHVTGIETSNKKGSDIFGTSYSKATSIAIKGAYCKNTDLPVNMRYMSEMKDKYQKPKMRSFSEARELKKEEDNKKVHFIGNPKDRELTKGLSESFKNAVFMKRKKIEDVPYILGYTGFRPGVISQSYFGKSFANESLNSVNKFLEKQYS
jgi:hypothetical protein